MPCARRYPLAAPPAKPELEARRIVEDLALALQASLLVRNAPAGDGRAFVMLPPTVNALAIVERALAV